MHRTHALAFCFVTLLIAFGCERRASQPVSIFSYLAAGWETELIATVQQSYAGWDVEIGDADNDGLNEVVTVTSPGSRMCVFEKAPEGWKTRFVARNLALDYPGMGLAVKIADLNQDGVNEIVAGTGQEKGGAAILHVMQLRGSKFRSLLVSRPAINWSSYTHGLSCYDLDRDGILEAVGAYCCGGEIIRYDFDRALTTAEARLIHNLSASCQGALLADVDNDGRIEYVASAGFREGKARVQIFEFDRRGELVLPARVVLDGHEGRKCFYAASTVGDLDNDGRNELVVGWKQRHGYAHTTILVYRVTKNAQVIYTLARDDTAFNSAYFENTMEIADADDDGRNELVISTHRDNLSESAGNRHLGCVLLYKIVNGETNRTLLAHLDEEKAESASLAVGDADNDGRNEIVLATGKGDRTKPGISYIAALRKTQGHAR